MTKQRLTLPEQKVREYANDLACEIAREQLAAVTDFGERCRKSGTEYLPAENCAVVGYLGRSYRIDFPDGEVSLAGAAEPVSIKDKILILHYFLWAKGTPLTGRTITYKELPEGISYYPTFFKRTIEPVINNFNDDLSRLPEAAGPLGGRRAGYGDAAVTFDAFPLVPLTFVLWRGDGEFPPNGSILFDSTIRDYLPTEDITILCETIAWRLVRLLKTGGE